MVCFCSGLYPSVGIRPIVPASKNFVGNTRLHAEAMVIHLSKGSISVMFMKNSK